VTTAVLPREHHLYLDGMGDELGPFATFGAQFFLVVAPIFLFRVVDAEVLPDLAGPALLAGTLGVLALAPRLVIHRIPVSGLALLMVAWMGLSVMWSGNTAATVTLLKRDMPVLIGLMLVIGMASFRHIVAALIWSIRISVLVTIIAVAASPSARVHIDPTGAAPDLAGWHGLFPHKNIMTPFLVFGILTVLTFDRSTILKWATLAGAGVLLVGSDSVTGLSSVFLAISVWVWLQLYRNLDLRGSSVFVVSSVSMALFGAVAVAASLSTITGASGKDLTFTGRTFIWSAALTLWKERPVWGWGADGVLSADPLTPRTAQAWREIGFDVPHAHNGTLDLGVQFGIVGVLIFVALFATTLISGLSILRDRPELGAWVGSVMIVQLYMSMSEPVFVRFGWLGVLLMLRLMMMRKYAVELSTGIGLADRVRHSRRWGVTENV